jgi:hypothetical protein
LFLVYQAERVGDFTGVDMKAPFDLIEAECDKCGEFTVQRKPKTGARVLSTSDQDNSAWRQVVCPKCKMWAEVLTIKHMDLETR